MRVSRKPDGKADDMLDPPKEPFEQLASDDVILAKGAEFQGTGLGGVKTHHVARDLDSGARLAYPLSRRDALSDANIFRHFVGLVLFEEEPEVPASVVLIKPKKATTYDNHRLECSNSKLPRFGRPKSFVPACMASKGPLGDLQQTNDNPSSSSLSSQFSVPNKRHRKKLNWKKGIGPDSPLMEFACDSESQMGITSEKFGVPHMKLSKEFGDLTDPEVQAQLDYQIWASPMAPNLWVWGAIPCTAGSVWQRLNAAKLGPSFQAYLRRQKSPIQEAVCQL